MLIQVGTNLVKGQEARKGFIKLKRIKKFLVEGSGKDSREKGEGLLRVKVYSKRKGGQGDG